MAEQQAPEHRHYDPLTSDAPRRKKGLGPFGVATIVVVAVVVATLALWELRILIALIFLAAFVYARLQGPAEVAELGEVAEAALEAEADALERHDSAVHK